LEKNNSLTRVVIHMSNWTRLLYTRVQLDACILVACKKYTRPIGHVYIINVSNWTRVLLHVSIWTRVLIHVSKWGVYTTSHDVKKTRG
jgi:hypothetical protein